MKANIGFGWLAEADCEAIFGKPFEHVSRFPKYLSFMQRPKAISHFTMSRESPVRSAEFRHLQVHRFPAAVVRVDTETGIPVRREDGLCIPCGHGKVGEAIGRISTAASGGGRFEGYTNATETEKKILRDG
jgi:hypothetical protein